MASALIFSNFLLARFFVAFVDLLGRFLETRKKTTTHTHTKPQRGAPKKKKNETPVYLADGH
jgi:hypothetical protein